MLSLSGNFLTVILFWSLCETPPRFRPSSFPVHPVTQERPLLLEQLLAAESSPLRHSFPIGCIRSCDENRVMAASAAVRLSMGLSLRHSRVIPDCRTCPLFKLKCSAKNMANLQRKGSFDSLKTINRHLQTSIGEWCSPLTLSLKPVFLSRLFT